MSPARSAAKSTKPAAPRRVEIPTSPLQIAIANRSRLVLSLLDQRADFASPLQRLSAVDVAAGLDHHYEGVRTAPRDIHRFIHGMRRWTPDLLLAFASWARTAYGLQIDPGWLTYGSLSDAPAPEIPADCELRGRTELDGLRRSTRTLREIRMAERQRRRGRA